MIRPELIPFAPLPHAVLRRTDLSAQAKCIFACVADLPPQADGRVHVSVGRLASAVGLPRRTATRHLHELELRSILSIERLPGRRLSIALLFSAEAATLSAEDPRQIGAALNTGAASQPAPVWPGGRANLARGSRQIGTPARVTALTTASSTTAGARAFSQVSQVAPLLWQAAVENLRRAYREAFPQAGGIPSRWLGLLAEQLLDGNEAVATLAAADIRAGLARADAGKRPFGFGWVVLAVQERGIRSSQQSSQSAAACRISPAEELARAAIEREHQAAQRQSDLDLAAFSALSPLEQDPWLAQARVKNPWLRKPELLARQAAHLFRQTCASAQTAQGERP